MSIQRMCNFSDEAGCHEENKPAKIQDLFVGRDLSYLGQLQALINQKPDGRHEESL